ncbi:MAG TPA: sulfatase [Thermoanaerobaculia bacterium]|nr:sulfatase [Thermoanaerobaculia bacterium]
MSRAGHLCAPGGPARLLGRIGAPALLFLLGAASLAGCAGCACSIDRRADHGPPNVVRVGTLLRVAAGAPVRLPPGELAPGAPYQVAAGFSTAEVARLRLEAQGDARLATLSWKLAQDRGFLPFRSLTFPLAADGKLHAYEVELQREPYWNGRIDGLRLQVGSGHLRLIGFTGQPPSDPYRSMLLRGESVPALPGLARLEIPLPSGLEAGTALETRLGLVPEYDRHGVRAVFRAYLERSGVRRLWLEQVVDGSATGEGQGWRLLRRELPGSGGEEGDLSRNQSGAGAATRLVLEVEARRDGAALPVGAALWGNPVLVRPRRPPGGNLVVILIDTLRADVLGAYGDPAGLTPRLDAFAREGIRFAAMQAPAPWTLPSVASLLTGLQPQTHGAGQRFGDLAPESPRHDDYAPSGLRFGVPTLASTLRQQGLYTIGVYHNLYVSPAFGLQQGFDEYASLEEPADLLVDNALQRLRRTSPDRRTFLYLHLFDLHAPYDPPEPECHAVAPRFAPIAHSAHSAQNAQSAHGARGAPGWPGCRADRGPDGTTVPAPALRPWFLGLYRAEVAFADRQVGRFLDGLRELGLDRSTVVAIVSDHGEEFWTRLASEGEMGYEARDHGHSLYQELLHVPALLRIPGHHPEVIDDPVELVDLFPTLLRAVGVEPPPSQGQDLTPLLDGHPAARPTLIADGILHGKQRWSVRRGPWKLVVPRDGALPVELYDLRGDPGELRNLAPRDSRLVASLRAWGEREIAARQEQRARFLAGSDALGATYLEWRYITKLRALGYLH